jgi:excisionase family DNA binding protein
MTTASAAPTNSLLLTPTEAAIEMRLGRSTVYELIASHELTTVKVRTARRIRRADLEAFVRGLPADAA